MENRVVKTIPATVDRYTKRMVKSKSLKKVAAYARVSTEAEEQQTSFSAQVRYYTEYIKKHDGWDFVKVYTDEGITGTSTKHREGFKEMINDALNGKIDLIITKSVSRFARNTVDSLTAIRQLKERGVECYFEKENIKTLDSKGELLITIMSSIAQEEARSISENCIWSQRKRFEEGKVSVPFGNFLGYDRGADGNLVINEEQAKVVRVIYGMFLQGYTAGAIARALTKKKISTPMGGQKWYESTVKSILKNEKYKGDALLQKTYTSDFLTKKKVKNNGEVPKFYVTDNHSAIVKKEVFDEVQNIINNPDKSRKNCVSIYSNKLKCGECNGWFVPKVWHSNDKYRKTVWRCADKDKFCCKTPCLSEEQIRKIFTLAVNRYLRRRTDILNDIYILKDKVKNIKGFEDFLEQLKNRPNIIGGFDEIMWLNTVDYLTVFYDKRAAVRFKNGVVIEVYQGG